MEWSMKRILIFLLFTQFFMLRAYASGDSSEVTVDASHLRYKIDKNIYGQFTEHLGHCIYGGIWVGPDSPIPNIDGIRKDVVEALKEIRVPVVRWPGGCFADEYHWKDGIGPRDRRPKMINTNWGGVTENNSFGTSEFLEFCSLIGAEPYITGNLGSGTVQELSQWVEYVNSDNVSPMTELRKKNGRDKSWGVKYWGLGNESWGCGGNMIPEYYSDLARRYGTFIKNYGSNKVFKIACGAGGNDYNWTEVVMKNDAQYIDGLSLHYYSFGSGTATNFDERGWFGIMKSTLEMDKLITKHSEIMDKYDPVKRVALVVDEYGTWYSVEPGTNPAFLYQQNTMRDAVAAACNLNIFNNHCDRVRMANIAQMVNVLQSLILTKGNKIVLTPTYYVFDLFKVHQNAIWIPARVQSASYILNGDTLPAVNCSASIDSAGRVHISLCNINPESQETVSCDIVKFNVNRVTGRVLTSSKMNACNTFEDPKAVLPREFSDFELNGNRINVKMPPMSIVVLELDGTLEMEKALELENPQQGINYSYYEGDWTQLPNFNDLKPKNAGTMDQIRIPDSNRGENFAVKYDGYIKIPRNGMYTFYLNSDDGSDLLIDGGLVVANDGRHAPQEASGDISLSAGYHKIEVTFFQAGGGMVLEASINGPGLKKQVIPAGMLFIERGSK
jgi:alpha-N-arabinofuranosidase